MAGIKQIKKSRPEKGRQRNVAHAVVECEQDVWLNDTLDVYLTGTMHPPRGGVFHPSVLSNACNRAVWLAYHERMIDTKLEPVLNRIFQNGNFLEKRVEGWLRNIGILMGREVPVRLDSPPISGRIDFIVRHPTYGISPIELKSINTAGFGRLRRPKPEHEIQLQIYLNLGNYAVGTVLYENKNDQKIKSFVIHQDKKRWDDILTRCFLIQTMEKAPNECTGEYWCACKNIPFETE
jgi:hypothetical protein